MYKKATVVFKMRRKTLHGGLTVASMLQSILNTG